jgi:hypothetical protein
MGLRTRRNQVHAVGRGRSNVTRYRLTTYQEESRWAARVARGV